MDLSRVFFPDKDGLFADVQHFFDIIFGDHMPALKGSSLEAVPHRRNVVAEGHAHRILYLHLLHICYAPFQISPSADAFSHIFPEGIFLFTATGSQQKALKPIPGRHRAAACRNHRHHIRADCARKDDISLICRKMHPGCSIA